MKPKRRPSASFVALCLVYGATIGFFGWSLDQPDLDRIWSLALQLRSGRLQHLGSGDTKLLRDGLRRHPRLAEALLDGPPIGLISENDDGWLATRRATLLRTAKAARLRHIRLDVQTPRDLLPLTVEVIGPGWRQSQRLDRQQRVSITLPPLEVGAELFELHLRGNGMTDDPSSIAIHLSFAEALP